MQKGFQLMKIIRLKAFSRIFNLNHISKTLRKCVIARRYDEAICKFSQNFFR